MYTSPTPSDNTPPCRPKLIFFGDPHGDFEPVILTVLRDAPTAIVLLGDIEARCPLEVELAAIVDLTEVWWIPGNHDTDAEASYDNLWHSKLAHRNLHGRVTRIAGYRVAGLGGIFREFVWDPRNPAQDAPFFSADKLRRHMRVPERWRGGVSLRHRSSIFPMDYLQLQKQRADILVTHEGLGGDPHGHPALDLLARDMRVQLVVHGHLHRQIDYRREGRLAAEAGLEAFGVDKDSHLVWPCNPASRERLFPVPTWP